MPVVSGSDALFGRYGQVGCRSTIYQNFKFWAYCCGYEVSKVDFRPKFFLKMQLILWRISICVLVVYKYMYRNPYFFMAAVEYKIYQLYAEKYANLLMQKCASYFRRIQSHSNCRVCRSFTGLHNIFVLSLMLCTLFSGPNNTVLWTFFVFTSFIYRNRQEWLMHGCDKSNVSRQDVCQDEGNRVRHLCNFLYSGAVVCLSCPIRFTMFWSPVSLNYRRHSGSPKNKSEF
jgi:hypothetical protein